MFKLNCSECKSDMHIVSRGNVDDSLWKLTTKGETKKWRKFKTPSKYRVVLMCTNGTCKKQAIFDGKGKADVHRSIHRKQRAFLEKK